MQDHYRTLDADPGASAAELRAAYLKLARANHPDRFGGPERHAAQARMQQINEAWNVLGVPHKRREYDAAHGMRTGGSGGGSGAFRGNATFSPFDDDPIDRTDLDLDPTPLVGSRRIPRWVSLMPVALVVWGVIVLALGMLVNAAAIIAFAAVVVLLGGAGFLLLPLFVMSRAERDPNL